MTDFQIEATGVRLAIGKSKLISEFESKDRIGLGRVMMAPISLGPSIERYAQRPNTAVMDMLAASMRMINQGQVRDIGSSHSSNHHPDIHPSISACRIG